MSGGRNRRSVPQGKPNWSPSLPYHDVQATARPNYNHVAPYSESRPSSECSLPQPAGYTGEPSYNELFFSDGTIDPSLLAPDYDQNSLYTDGTICLTDTGGNFTQGSGHYSTQTSAEDWPSEGPSASHALPRRTATRHDTGNDLTYPNVAQGSPTLPSHAMPGGSRKRSQTAVDHDGASQGPAKQPKVISTSAGHSLSDDERQMIYFWTKTHNVITPTPSQTEFCIDMIVGSREVVSDSVREAVRSNLELYFKQNNVLVVPGYDPADSTVVPLEHDPSGEQYSDINQGPQTSHSVADMSTLDVVRAVEEYIRSAQARTCGKRQDQPRGRLHCVHWCGFATDTPDTWIRHAKIKCLQEFWSCVKCRGDPKSRHTIFHRADKIRQHFKDSHFKDVAKERVHEEELDRLIVESRVDHPPAVYDPQCRFCSHPFESWSDRNHHLCAHFFANVSEEPWNEDSWHPDWPRHLLPVCGCPTCQSAAQLAPDPDNLNGPDQHDGPGNSREDEPDADGRYTGQHSGWNKGGQCQAPRPGSAARSFSRGNPYSSYRGHGATDSSEGSPLLLRFLEAVEGQWFKLPFRHIDTLGTGATATVNKIEHIDTRLVFARKTINTCNRNRFRRVMHEIEVMKTLSHQSFVRFVAAYREERAVHIIMTPAAECSLRQYLRSPRAWHHEKFSSRAWFGALASAVDYLHNTALAAHLDLKPENILLSSSHRYQVCISDFGSSKRLSTLTSTFLKVDGVTPMYCSPEAKERRAVGSKADIWSLGCVFTELLTVELGLTVTGLHAHLGLTSRVKSWSNTYQSKVTEMRLWIMGLRRGCEPLAQGILDVCQSMLNYDASSRPTASELSRTIFLVYLQGSTYPQQDVHGRSQYVNIPALLRSWGSLRWQWQFSNNYLGSFGFLADTKQDLCVRDWSVRGYSGSCFSDCMQDETWQYDNVGMKGKLLESRSSVDLVGLGIWDEQALSTVPPTYHSCYEIAIDTGCSSYLTTEQSIELRQLLGLEDPSDCSVLGTA